ncbi:hypothetical protein LTR15_011511 [Elasticomyces elasticus]|nr:hypothetical protein LTR15_011511 [Elasticomyces elasticus]
MKTALGFRLAIFAWIPTAFSGLSDYTQCDHLEALLPDDAIATISFSETVASGSNFTGNTSEPSYNSPQSDLPASCRVSFTVSTSLNSSAGAEVWLPTDWTGRYLSVGNGGFAGAVNYPDLVWGLRKGFAVMSTDTGHTSSQSDGSWLSNPEQAIDWGHRALHITTLAAKEIVDAYYTQSIQHSYYAGCSTGGRQGLNAAQRYPNDFDGVLVGSAIPWQTHTSAWQTYVALQQYPSNASTYIPTSMWPIIYSAVLDQCDALDGVTDGIIMDPARCNFQPEVLLCGMPEVNATACLNTAQLENLKRMYRPWLTSSGELVNPGISHSGEASFSFIMNQPQPQFGPIFYGYGVVNDSTWDWGKISVETVALADSINPGGANAYNPDMRPFQDAGGKLIHYHGYADPLIPTYNAPAWYDKLVGFYSDIGRGGQVPDWYRLFAIPGMGHCSGGVGAWVVDGASQRITPVTDDSAHSMLWSLVAWVEGRNGTIGTAPESVMGTKFVNDTPSSGVAFERPVCRWPSVAQYAGGNASNSRSWFCPMTGVY